MAPPPPHAPLDNLQSMINAILIETGRALRTADRSGGKSMAQANIRLRNFMPLAESNFHNALDELEGDILRAKAVLGRDLRELRTKRQEAENPSVVVAEPTIISSESPLTNVDTKSQSKADLTAQFSAQEEKAAQGDPMNLDEAASGDSKDKIKTEAGTTLKRPDKEEQILLGESLKASPEELKTLENPTTAAATTTAQTSIAPVGLGINTTTVDATNETKASAVSEPSTDVQDFDFDSMFDTTGGNNESSLPVDESDYNVTNNETQNNDFGSSFDLSSFPNQNNNNTSNNNDDVSALLPGLESYANTGGDSDFNMLDISQDNTGTEPTANNVESTTQNNTIEDDLFGDLAADGNNNEDLDTDLGMTMGNHESIFDDLDLDLPDFGNGDDAGNGDDIMVHGEFDNAFFGLED